MPFFDVIDMKFKDFESNALVKVTDYGLGIPVDKLSSLSNLY
jgi:signal transduction histidine kinase